MTIRLLLAVAATALSQILLHPVKAADSEDSVSVPAVDVIAERFKLVETAPLRVEMTISVEMSGITVGEGRDSFEHDGDRYRVVSEARTAGLARALKRVDEKRESRGLVTGHGIRPLYFRQERTGKRPKTATFDWEAGKLKLSEGEESETVDLPEFVLDQPVQVVERALGLLLLGAAITATVVIKSHMMSVPFRPMIENRDALVRPHAATLGNPDAKVHIVEFLDPACAACATMHAEVKRLLALYPDKVRLTARHVAFHDGSDYAIKVLEAAKTQGKYWQTLEALYATQSSWVVGNVVQPAAIWRAVDQVGLNTEQLKADFDRPEVAQQFDQDIRDARLLRVAETPNAVAGYPAVRARGTIGMPLRGLSVTMACGRGRSAPANSSCQRCAIVAISSTPSIHANGSPMQTRAPPPNG